MRHKVAYIRMFSWTLRIVVAIAAVTLGLPASPADAAAVGGSRVVFGTEAGAFLADADGANRVQIAGVPGGKICDIGINAPCRARLGAIALSPTHRFLAFAYRVGGPSGEHTRPQEDYGHLELRVLDLQGGTTRVIAKYGADQYGYIDPEALKNVQWSFDGSRVGWQGDFTAAGRSFVSARPDGSDLVIVRRQIIQFGDWSLDGRVYYTAEEPAPGKDATDCHAAVRSMHFTGASDSLVVRGHEHNGVRAWSDGRISFDRTSYTWGANQQCQQTEGRGLFVSNRDGSQPRRITLLTREYLRHAPSPDETMVLYARLAPGQMWSASQHVQWNLVNVDGSGNRRVDFPPDAVSVNWVKRLVLPARAPRAVALAVASGQDGYWAAFSDGGVTAGGGAPPYGSMRGRPLAHPIVAAASTSSGNGYWLLGRDGGVFSFGDAHFHGSTGDRRLNRPVVTMAGDPRGRGYWFAASDGGVFSFGAPFLGSAGNLRLAQPVVGMTPTRTGNGYWLVARDGGVFSFGDAKFAGSTGAMRLNQPIVAMAADPDGTGYWLVAADGGVFAFGATFHGSGVGKFAPGDPVVAMAARTSGGYSLLSASGNVASGS